MFETIPQGSVLWNTVRGVGGEEYSSVRLGRVPELLESSNRALVDAALWVIDGAGHRR